MLNKRNKSPAVNEIINFRVVTKSIDVVKIKYLRTIYVYLESIVSVRCKNVK